MYMIYTYMYMLLEISFSSMIMELATVSCIKRLQSNCCVSTRYSYRLSYRTFNLIRFYNLYFYYFRTFNIHIHKK